MRRLLRWGKWVALVVIVVLGAALIWLHTASGREFLRKRVEAGLAGSFPGSKVGSVTGSVFGTLVVHDLVVQGADGKPLVTVGTAEVAVSLLPLVGKTVRVDRLVVSDVVAMPRKQPPKQESGGGSSWSVELPDIAVHRARVVLPDEEVRDIELAASVRIPAEGPLTAVAAVKATWRGLAVEATGYARVGDIVEVPFAQVATGAAGAAVFAAKLGDTPTGEAFARISPALATTLKVADLPSELLAIVHARPGGAIAMHATLGDATARVGAVVDLANRRGKGVVIADAPKYGAAVVALAGDLEHATGMIAGETEQQGHLVHALIAVNGTRAGGWLAAHAGSDVGRASVVATVKRKGEAFELAGGTVTAHATRVDVADADGVHARAGSADVALAARGPVWPEPKVRVDGTLAASAIAYAPFAVAGASARLVDVDVVRTGLAGRLHLEASGMQRAGTPLGAASVDTRVTAGFDGTLTALIDGHRYKSIAAGVWTGTGGTVTVDDATIKIRELHSSPGAGSVAANATITRASGDLVADVTAKDVGLATLAPGTAGSVSATAHATRRGLRWDASATFAAKSLVADPRQPPLDVRGALTVAGRHVIVTTSAANPDIGEVRVAAEVDGPYDITDAPAWKRLERKAVRSLAVTVVDAKLAGADPRLSGVLDGGAAITADGAHGGLHLHGFHTKAGDLDVDMTLSAAEHGEIATAETVQLVGVASADGVVHIALPRHPFDPAAWRALGPRVFADGSLAAHDVHFDPKVLAKLGVVAPYQGTVDIDAEVAEGATGATIKVGVRDVSGGRIVKPVSAFLDGGIDELGAHATVTLKSGELQLLEATAGAPLTVDQIRSGNVTGAPLTGSIAFGALPKPGVEPDSVPAAELLAIVGRRDVSAGSIEGTITVGGTLLAPTGDAVITTKNITVPASIEGRPPARLADLRVKAHWDGKEVNLDVMGHEGKTGILHAALYGPPKQPAKLHASFESHDIDLAPFAAFAPGQLAGARGTVDASLVLDGIDPVTGDLHGKLLIQKGRLPIHDMVGTFRDGTVDVTIANHTVEASLKGKLGRGSVEGKATIALAGSTPKKADATLKIRGISLIRAHQPQIDADVTANLAHSDKWTGKIAIKSGRVLVPASGGQALLDSFTPTDMVFVDGPPPKLGSLLTRQPPSKPWLVTDIDLGRTTVDVEDEQYQVKGAILGHLTLSLGGDGIGLDGAIDAERGDIELLGQRSQLDHGSVVFDGTIDPLLNVRVVRDLTDMTVTCEVQGRLSKPDVKFSSDSGSYSQGDLLAIFVGGQAGGDHSDFGQAAATAGAGLASNVITKKLLRRFPIKLDLHYTPATTGTSAAYGVSRWISENLYVEGRYHPEARVDENANEVIGEYHFGRHTLLSGNAGDRGYAGGDLVFSFHW